PTSWIVVVSCWTPFLLLPDSPNHEAKWPLAETPLGSSGVKVAVPSSVPVTQNSSAPGAVKKVTWKTSFAATAVTVPGAPVHGFVTCSENSLTLWACVVIVTVPWPPASASAAPAASNATTAARLAPCSRRLSIRSLLSPRKDLIRGPRPQRTRLLANPSPSTTQRRHPFWNEFYVRWRTQASRAPPSARDTVSMRGSYG